MTLTYRWLVVLAVVLFALIEAALCHAQVVVVEGEYPGAHYPAAGCEEATGGIETWEVCGDCDGDRRVTIAELVSVVRNALDSDSAPERRGAQ